MFSSSFLLALTLILGKPSYLTGASNQLTPPGFDKTVLLKLVNDVRKKGCQCGDQYYPSAPAVTWNEQLETAALNHSKDMFENRYLDHRDKAGKSAGDRIKEAGYKWSTYGENIAHGFSTEKAVVDGWLRSPGHCANIMTSYFREIGVANSGSYWTMTLATK